MEEEARTEAREYARTRGGPRSRLVEAIAVLLLARPMRAAEIAEVLGYNSRYISSYLSYWRSRGLFEYESGYWSLTGQGEEYARNILEREMNSRVTQYAALARRLLENPTQPVRQTMNDKPGAPGQQQSGGDLPFTVPGKGKRGKKQQERLTRSCIRAVLAELDLGEDEETVLEALLDHYAKWGSTYTYLDHLERQLDADRVWLLTVARMLQAKKLIYIYSDKRLGVRIGLSKRLRELLADCRGRE